MNLHDDPTQRVKIIEQTTQIMHEEKDLILEAFFIQCKISGRELNTQEVNDAVDLMIIVFSGLIAKGRVIIG